MKVGDKVAVLTMQGYIVEIAEIERETKLYWIVSDKKYRKNDLVEPGRGWSRCSIEPLTQKHVDEIRHRGIARKLFETNWSYIDLETLEKVFAIVYGMTDTNGK